MVNRAAFVALALVLVGCTSGGTFGLPQQFGTNVESAFNTPPAAATSQPWSWATRSAAIPLHSADQLHRL